MTLRSTLKTEVHYWLPMVLITYALINGYLSGWTSWVVPDLSIPLKIDGDPISYGVMMQRQIDGFWYFEDIRFGYPFISTQYDFPMSFLNGVLFEVFGFIVPSWHAVYTMYFVFSFVVNAIVCYAVMRAVKISILWAIIGTVLFNFVPFHFARVGHLPYTIYFEVPLVYYMAWQLWQASPQLWQRHNILPSSVIGFMIGCNNVYYAVFSLVIIILTTVVVTWREKSIQLWWSGVALVGAIVIGILSGLLPSISYWLDSPNVVPLNRPIEDSVTYALWPVGLFTFLPDNIIWSDTYIKELGVKWNEYYTNSMLGSLGIIIVLWGMMSAWLNRNVDSFMRFLGVQLVFLLTYSVIGGGGLLVSLLVSSIIRASNRFAIFAMFIGIIALVWTMQQWMTRLHINTRSKLILVGVICLISIGIDNPIVQNPMKYAPFEIRKEAWQRELQFFHDVETLAGTGAAIYQLPALAFPENDPNYRQVRCALYTRLYCSHGNVFGRDGVKFYYMLQGVPVTTQIAVLSRLGFTGIMIDRTYHDMNKVENAWRTTLGYAPALQSADNQMAYYVLPPPIGAVQAGRQTEEIIEAAQFLQDEYALRTQTDMRIPVDFTKPWFPGSVKTVSGVYDYTTQGRWSNASSFDDVVITFNTPLPKAFKLDITALAWDRNINKPVTVVVGTQRQQVYFGGGFTTQSIDFHTDGNTNTITIIPAIRHPASKGDARFLALLFQKIQITPR